MFTIVILPSNQGPDGKLADAELHFTSGILSGVKLVGFAVWTRRDGTLNVTLPARQYSVNGERRSFALVRPVSDPEATVGLRDAIVEAYREFVIEENREVAR